MVLSLKGNEKMLCLLKGLYLIKNGNLKDLFVMGCHQGKDKLLTKEKLCKVNGNKVLFMEMHKLLNIIKSFNHNYGFMDN